MRRPVAVARPSARGGSGRRLVVGLMVLGLVAALLGIGYQRGQTRGCLAFYGPEAARAITSAPHVELWTGLRPGPDGRRLLAAHRLDVSEAKGLVHLRRGLVEDANFRLGTADDHPPAAGEWSSALVFSPGPVARVDGSPAAVAVLFDAGGGDGTPRWLCVAGKGGMIPIGRIGGGIRTWIESTLAGQATPGR